MKDNIQGEKTACVQIQRFEIIWYIQLTKRLTKWRKQFDVHNLKKNRQPEYGVNVIFSPLALGFHL